MDDLFVHTVRIPESTEMAQEEEWANADMRTLEERVADAEEDKLGFGMPTDGNVEDWVTFRP